MTNNDLSFETIPLSIFENTNICGTIYHRILTSTKSFSVYVTLKRQHLSTNLKKHKLARFHTTQLMPLSPHARKSEIVLNSEFDAVDSVFQVRDSRFFVRGTGILDSKRKISCIPDSTGKNLLNSGIRITLHVATFGRSMVHGNRPGSERMRLPEERHQGRPNRQNEAMTRRCLGI